MYILKITLIILFLAVGYNHDIEMNQQQTITNGE